MYINLRKNLLGIKTRFYNYDSFRLFLLFTYRSIFTYYNL